MRTAKARRARRSARLCIAAPHRRGVYFRETRDWPIGFNGLHLFNGRGGTIILGAQASPCLTLGQKRIMDELLGLEDDFDDFGDNDGSA